ncbi:hypothetical protein QZN06_11645 [Burkholderia multivorans]|uniref:hypothetical protein n=1 Tax=Burkholderia multivorans TaxID=87883 RepID=UPI0021597054|nr:hypothetical protein [Burkholderia multivorans]MDN8009220.1 hypothetical protein [Burkholderia multivorans]
MAVTIDLGSGKRATLSSDGGAIRTAEQRAAVSELMLHWPRYPGLTSGAIGYLQDLGLAGSLSGDPVAALRAAIESGRVAVAIDKVIPRGGGAAGGQPSPPPFPKANRLAVVPGVPSLPVDKPLPSWATPSDVSAGELMSYLQSVVAGTGGAVAGTASGLVDGTALADAAPFDYTPDVLSGDVEELAASTNNPNYAAKMLGYERKIFGNMIHQMKDANDLGGADNVLWHDNGDVEFKGVVIDNMHNYGD